MTALVPVDGACTVCRDGLHHQCEHAAEWCACRNRAHVLVTVPDVWTLDDLAALERDYGRGGHDDVLALIRGARAVTRLCSGGGYVEADAVLSQLNGGT